MGSEDKTKIHRIRIKNEKFNKKEILGDVDYPSENEKNSVHLEEKSDSAEMK